jgi:hypothetical protein
VWLYTIGINADIWKEKPHQLIASKDILNEQVAEDRGKGKVPPLSQIQIRKDFFHGKSISVK